VGVDLPGVDDDDEPDLRSAAVPEEATGDEPVASAAAVVSPAVVQIETGVGLGSGVIYDEAGFILTNAHVVGGATEVNVRLASGRTLPGRVIGAHEPTDIAVVQVVSDSALEAAPLALEGDLEVGQLTVAVGSPFGLDQTVTSGIVSAINRAVPSENGNFVGMLQTDAAINSGNSGGALADRYGRVIGINTAIRTTNGGNAGIGFAVPIGTAASVAEQLRAGQPVELGYLGVGLNEVEGPGALLTEVVRGSPAEGVLMTGDVVVALDGRPVSGPAELATAVKGRAPGSSVSVEVNRNGDPVTVDVELGGLEG